MSKAQNQSSQGYYGAARLSDRFESLLGVDIPVEALKAANERDLDLILTFLRRYPRNDPRVPDDPLESHAVLDLLQRSLPTAAWRAVYHAHHSRIDALTGRKARETIDTAEWREYEILKDLFRETPRVSDQKNDVFQCAIFSNRIPPTGRGKTATMYSLSEVAQTVNPDIRIISNVPSDPFETLPREWSEIEKLVKEADREILLLIDEAAQFLLYADQTAGKSVSLMLRLLRHNNAHVIFIIHTGMDMPADPRRQMYFINKISDKRAVLGYGIKKMTGKDRMEINEEIATFKNIPMTTVPYDSEGKAANAIRFGDSKENQKIAQMLRDKGATYEEIAEVMDVSTSTAHKYVNPDSDD